MKEIQAMAEPCSAHGPSGKSSVSIDDFAKNPFVGNGEYRLKGDRVCCTVKKTSKGIEKPQSQITFIFELEKYIQKTPDISEKTLLNLKSRVKELSDYQKNIEPSRKMSFVEKMRYFLIKKIGIPLAEHLVAKINETIDKKTPLQPLKLEALEKLVETITTGNFNENEDENLTQRRNFQQYLNDSDNNSRRYECIASFLDYVRDVPILAKDLYVRASEVVNHEVEYINSEIAVRNDIDTKLEPIKFVTPKEFREALAKFLNGNQSSVEQVIKDLLIAKHRLDNSSDKKDKKRIEILEEKLELAKEHLRIHYKISRKISKKISPMPGIIRVKPFTGDDPKTAVENYIDEIMKELPNIPQKGE